MKQKRMLGTLLSVILVFFNSVSVSAAPSREQFDPDYYASMYPDVRAVYGNDAEALWNHFITYGFAEGRSMNGLPDSDVREEGAGTELSGNAAGFQVSAEIGARNFCAGIYFCAFIKEDQTLWTCGGAGSIGSMMMMPADWIAGDWMEGSRGVPVKVMDHVKSVYSNGDMTCYAITTDNSLWALGENNGAFGDGTVQPSRIPVKIMDDVVYVESKKYSWYEPGAYQSIHQGYAVIALKSDGTLWGWGTNHWGELGDGTCNPHLTPVKIMDHVVYAANATYYSGMTDDVASTYAIQSDGSLWAWGHNHAGQLGNGNRDSQLSPVKIMDHVRTFQTKDGSCTAIKTDGSCWHWGSSFSHTEGMMILHNAITHPKKIADGVFTAASSDLANYMIKQDNILWAWGKAPALDFTGSGQSFESAVPVPIMENVSSIHVGAFSTFAIRTDNTLWGWGMNSNGEIGNRTAERIPSPTFVMDQVFDIYTTSFNTYILRTDGTLWGCGADEYCQLGQGSWEHQRTAPVKIADRVKIG